MPKRFSRFFTESTLNFKLWKLPAIALGILVPTTFVALPSIALMSQGKVYFTIPPLLVSARSTNQAAKQPSTYEFLVQVPESAGEPLKTLKITQDPGADFITLDQSQVRAEIVGQVQSAQAMNSQLSPESVSPQSSSNESGNMQSSDSRIGNMQSPSADIEATPSAPIESMQPPMTGGVPSTLEGMQPSMPNQRRSSTLDPQYYSYEAIQARATQPVYSGPTQPSTTASDTQQSDSRGGRKLTLANIGGDDLVPGEAVVQFDPPVAPGTTVRVSIPAIANPQSGGTYLFGVTAYPAGENSYGQFLGYKQIRFYQN